MAKRKAKAKRSLGSLPKGLPNKNSSMNPFEVIKRHKNVKSDVNKRPDQAHASKFSESLLRRQIQHRAVLQSSKKVNSFVDRRIGELTMSHEEKTLARLVKERSGRSKRNLKYTLDDDVDLDVLTHRGQSIDHTNMSNHIILDSDEEDAGNLDAMDTELNFGGLDTDPHSNPYGPLGGKHKDLMQTYTQKKNDLDEMIKRRKLMKAEKLMSKEQQAETFESLDQDFEELSKYLQFRDKEIERRAENEKKKKGELSQEEKEMAEWDKEMKSYLFEPKVKATDRTKSAEEIAKEEADRLHELESKRLARMNGDFDHDQLSDISDDESHRKRKIKKRKAAQSSGETLDYSDDEDKDEEKVKVAFTHEGLVYLDQHGTILSKVGEEEDENNESDTDEGTDNEDESEDEENNEVSKGMFLEVGTRVEASYRASEQFDGHESWHAGKVVRSHVHQDGRVTYDVDYDDGDYENGVKAEHVRKIAKESKDEGMHLKKEEEALKLKRKRQKAKERAREEMPFVFEVPTTIERLHEMIETHASTGKEVSLIIERIHASNSVRLDKKNMEKMQNFYDVLLRRFVAVGDAIHTSGRGGIELNRYEQLDAITRVLYTMAQDAPESAGAVWGRRLGVFQNAHAKRMRDMDLGISSENEDSMAWPGLGTLLLFRALPHIFPVTDRSHQVVTPAMLLLCQIVSQAPVSSISDLISGLFSCGVIFEFSKEAHRLVPEAIGFLSSALRLFSPKPIHMKLPNMKDIQHQEFRRQLISPDSEEKTFLPLEKAEIEKSSTVTSIFYSILYLVDTWIEKFGNSLNGGEPEAFSELSCSLKALSSSSKKSPLPPFAIKRIAITQTKLSHCLSVNRGPLARRMDTSTSKSSIKSLAPRLEDPERYRKSKDQGKNSNQIAVGRMQREFKREHKAVARELRLDGVFVENERRREKEKKDSLERAKRHKNLAWLEGEQAAMNQQVAQGGGLLSGGGMGAARAKAKSAKLGIKKGGKF